MSLQTLTSGKMVEQDVTLSFPEFLLPLLNPPTVTILHFRLITHVPCCHLRSPLLPPSSLPASYFHLAPISPPLSSWSQMQETKARPRIVSISSVIAWGECDLLLRRGLRRLG